VEVVVALVVLVWVVLEVAVVVEVAVVLVWVVLEVEVAEVAVGNLRPL
jgi:hypothetical protein